MTADDLWTLTLERWRNNNQRENIVDRLTNDKLRMLKEHADKAVLAPMTMPPTPEVVLSLATELEERREEVSRMQSAVDKALSILRGVPEAVRRYQPGADNPLRADIAKQMQQPGEPLALVKKLDPNKPRMSDRQLLKVIAAAEAQQPSAAVLWSAALPNSQFTTAELVELLTELLQRRAWYDEADQKREQR
jgi:hypothetical protein